jgi:leucyl-tRNA synthetase
MNNMKNIVVMFPYPSGAGLHLGHYYNYAIVDSYCRFLRYEGEEVFQPFGYDAFGLPAENYARSIGGDPKEVTWDNIYKFRCQMKRMNTLYDERLVTCMESYTKWTQWIFKKLYDHGLAYKKFGKVNWCSSCETVLANEQVKDERCDRCRSQVEQKDMNQWYFKITDYRDRLIAGLDKMESGSYPEGTIKQQRLWLENLKDWCVSRQRKWGCPIPIEGETDTLDTFVDSSFYYLRYLTDSQIEFLPSGAYKPVDLYVGGAEHACMHLIYARFIHYFLYDIGVVPQEEPFNKVIHQGMITRNGAKMGKSKGNALDPDDYDPDELRFFLMFLGPYTDGGDWNDKGIKGISRFLKRMKIWLKQESVSESENIDVEGLKKTIRQHLFNWKVNKVVSSFMEFYNKNKNRIISPEKANEVVTLLKIFAPDFSV